MHPDGYIEIDSTVLLPGEKLYEELPIEAVSEATAPLQIFRGRELAIATAEVFDAVLD